MLPESHVKLVVSSEHSYITNLGLLFLKTLRSYEAGDMLKPIRKYGKNFQNFSLPPMTMARDGKWWQF